MPAVDIRIGASYLTSKQERDAMPDRWEAIAEESLMRNLAFLLQREKAEMITKEDDYVEKRIDLYVASPKIFWKIVREEAEKIAFQFGRK